MRLSIGTPANAQCQRVRLMLRFDDVNPCLGSIQPKYTHRRVLPMRLHEWDTSIESHRTIQLVFEHVSVIQAIRLIIVSISATGVLQRKWSSMLSNTIDVLISRESDVNCNTFRSFGLG